LEEEGIGMEVNLPTQQREINRRRITTSSRRITRVREKITSITRRRS